MLNYNNIKSISKELFSLVYSIALKYKNDFVDFDDLIQEGFIGLYKAQKNFNPDKKVLFKTYAYYWIKKQILSYLKKQNKFEILSFNEIDLDSLKYNEDFNEENILLSNLQKKIDFDNYCLTKLETEILKLCFYEKLPFREISKRLDLSTERVRQLYQRAIRKIKINKNLTKDLIKINC